MDPRRLCGARAGALAALLPTNVRVMSTGPGVPNPQGNNGLGAVAAVSATDAVIMKPARVKLS